VYPRFSEILVRSALRDTRVVAISGPRQSGKTTLARRFAQQGRIYITLDKPTLAAAKSDPAAFIRGLERAIIDEVQRAPDLLLAIKQSVDEDPRPGRFLLTGSANLLTIKTVNESLAGRVEVVPLYPLSRSEQLRSKIPEFICKIFHGAVTTTSRIFWWKQVITSCRDCGLSGCNQAPSRTAPRRLVSRLDQVDRRTRHSGNRRYRKSRPDPTIVALSARFAGQLINLSELGRTLGLDHKTVGHYLRVLEQIYLLQRVQPWSRNELSRLVKTPKLHFVDSGLLTAMRGYSIGRLRSDRNLLGSLLETFVFSALVKSTAWTKELVSIFHYRDKDQVEVDFILENAGGQVVGIEVKAAASIRRRDFAGLERVAAATGSAFVQCILLHDGDQTLSFGERLRAAPFPTLWA
jgi:predicted AAA+ superfamily ATPase